MGLLSFFAERKALRAHPDVVEALAARNQPFMPLIATPTPSARVRDAFVQAQSAAYGYMYGHQPAIRKVVDYLAANVAQLGLKLYQRRGDNDRKEIAEHAAAQSLRYPNTWTTSQRFIFKLCADFLVYDDAFALKFRTEDGPPLLLGIPPHAVGVVGPSLYEADAYRIWRADGTFFDVSPADIIHWAGYDPADPRRGISKLETLRQELAGDRANQAALADLAEAGFLGPGHIERPLEAPEWQQPDIERFLSQFEERSKDWKKKPVLEEGMKFVPASVSPKDAQVLESRKFTEEQVAGLYGLSHVPPQGKDEQHQFYTDVLPPICEALASHLDLGLLQAEFDETDKYFAFDLDEKLMGDDRLKALVSAAGAPVLTRNEARRKLNLPTKEDGDELVTPMNVTVGGKPSPAVMPIQDPNKPSQDGEFREEEPKRLTNGKVDTKALLIARRDAKQRRRDDYAAEFAGMLSEFFDRQARSLKSKGLDSKALEDERWDRELANDLLKAAKRIVKHEGDVEAARMGLGDFDQKRVQNYLARASTEQARAMNEATRSALVASEADEVFARSEARAQAAGMSLATALSSFAATEAAKQTPDADRRLKTWIVTSSASEHPEMDGEAVPLFSTFSNGAQMPPADHPGCQCICEVG